MRFCSCYGIVVCRFISPCSLRGWDSSTLLTSINSILQAAYAHFSYSRCLINHYETWGLLPGTKTWSPHDIIPSCLFCSIILSSCISSVVSWLAERHLGVPHEKSTTICFRAFSWYVVVPGREWIFVSKDILYT